MSRPCSPLPPAWAAPTFTAPSCAGQRQLGSLRDHGARSISSAPSLSWASYGRVRSCPSKPFWATVGFWCRVPRPEHPRRSHTAGRPRAPPTPRAGFTMGCSGPAEQSRKGPGSDSPAQRPQGAGPLPWQAAPQDSPATGLWCVRAWVGVARLAEAHGGDRPCRPVTPR